MRIRSVAAVLDGTPEALGQVKACARSLVSCPDGGELGMSTGSEAGAGRWRTIVWVSILAGAGTLALMGGA